MELVRTALSCTFPSTRPRDSGGGPKKVSNLHVCEGSGSEAGAWSGGSSGSVRRLGSVSRLSLPTQVGIGGEGGWGVHG